MNLEAIHLLEQIAREKGIDKDYLIDAIKSAIEVAARKNFPKLQTLHTEFDPETGEIKIFSEMTVVEKLENVHQEADLREARNINPEAEVGETILVPVIMENYGRIASQMAKQVILQKVREAEIDNTYNEFIDKKGELINGGVQRFEHGDIIVDLGKTEGVLPRREQVFRESFNRGERIRAYVLDVRKTAKNAMVILSRTHTGLIRRLFELEVPEISEGMVEIIDVAREPSGRTKITVRSNERDIDAVGACVGMRGMRVQAIVQELRGEKIDIVEYSEDPQEFIRNAISPAKISRIVLNEEEKQMTLIVADDQMSLAIGKKGQNVRLAAKLVKWKVDIKGESENLGLLQPSLGLLGSSKVAKVDYLDSVKNAKGLGERIVAILFADSVNTAIQVAELGVQGLTKLAGIGPKKAEALLALAEEQVQQAQEEETALAESNAGSVDVPSGEASEEVAAEEGQEAPGSNEETESAPDAEEGSEAEEEDDDDQDLPLQNLQELNAETIQLLEQNGFQTIAELSITALDELTAIDGIDEDIAQAILEQAKSIMEGLESAQN